MVQLSHPYMTTGKIKALTIWNLVCKVMSLLFNTLSRFVIAFFSKVQVSFNFMAAVTVHSDFGAQENKVSCFHFGYSNKNEWKSNKMENPVLWLQWPHFKWSKAAGSLWLHLRSTAEQIKNFPSPQTVLLEDVFRGFPVAKDSGDSTPILHPSHSLNILMAEMESERKFF